MPLASSSYSYPLLGAFWTIFEIFLWLIWVLIIPLIGVLVYLIVRGGSMHERSVRDQQQADQEFRSYVQEAASGGTPADQLSKLADLRDRGVITSEEFDREKAKILASH